jgi:hypothetical protein
MVSHVAQAGIKAYLPKQRLKYTSAQQFPERVVRARMRGKQGNVGLAANWRMFNLFAVGGTPGTTSETGD